jgi:hypothetical protein
MANFGDITADSVNNNANGIVVLDGTGKLPILNGSALTGVTATIGANSVTNAMLVNVSTATFKGRTTAGTGSPEDLTVTQATALLNSFVGDSGAGGTKGLVIAPAIGDSGKYLRGDGTWQTVAGAGDMVLASAQTNSGIKTFLDTTMKLRNVANTFDGYFVNTNTANRIYTLQDSAGTIAFINVGQTFTGVQTFSTPIATGSVATMSATVGGGVPTPPNNTTTFLRGDGTFAIPTTAVTFTTIEKDLGLVARSGKFTITSSGMTIGKEVIVKQATAAYTNKGTLADESSMDNVFAHGIVTSATNIDVYWSSQTAVKGNFKFNYIINS